jgi:hypothetical protein
VSVDQVVEVETVVSPIPSTTLAPPMWRWSTTVYWSGQQSRHEYGNADTIAHAWSCATRAALRLAALGPFAGEPGSPFAKRAAQRWEAAEARRQLDP